MILVYRKLIHGEEKYFSSTMVSLRLFRQKTQAAAETAACGFGVVHGDEIAADEYGHEEVQMADSLSSTASRELRVFVCSYYLLAGLLANNCLVSRNSQKEMAKA